MKRSYVAIGILLAFGLSSCDNEVDVVYPSFGSGSILPQTTPISSATRGAMEGVYAVRAGGDQFGQSVVLQWNGDYLSVYTGTHAGYFIMQGGRLDSALYFEGYWRYAVSTQTGLLRLTIESDTGGKYLLGDSTASSQIVLGGAYGNNDDLPTTALALEYVRPIRTEILSQKFWVLAHRGGGRNSEYLGVSENSLDMISLAERFGADGIEIDVKVSTDGEPFLYHDKDVNLRLIQKSVFWGPIENFSFPQLRTLLRLANGERIPTLDEALEFVLDKTTLSFVWLDLKSDKNEIPLVIPIQQKYLDLARQRGRDLEIVLGLPTEDKVDNLAAIPNHENAPSLCELELDLVRKVNSRVWAPRWTQGLQTSDVRAMQAEGRRAFVWTLDVDRYISTFVTDGEFDGILTNYPTLVAYYHYVR
ncbi:MAG: glycerophosphodiester phosphodiesterase family protein [Bacteroidota bacterium]